MQLQPQTLGYVIGALVAIHAVIQGSDSARMLGANPLSTGRFIWAYVKELVKGLALLVPALIAVLSAREKGNAEAETVLWQVAVTSLSIYIGSFVFTRMIFDIFARLPANLKKQFSKQGAPAESQKADAQSGEKSKDQSSTQPEVSVEVTVTRKDTPVKVKVHVD